MERWDEAVLPRRVDISLQSGTLHTLTSPVQLPVHRSLLFGENRTIETGRSSPIWDPMFWVVFIQLSKYGRLKGGKRTTCFHFCKKVFANIDYFAERHFGILPLILYSGLCSRVGDEGTRTCVRADG